MLWDGEDRRGGLGSGGGRGETLEDCGRSDRSRLEMMVLLDWVEVYLEQKRKVSC